jgi:hypothetical protein
MQLLLPIAHHGPGAALAGADEGRSGIVQGHGTPLRDAEELAGAIDATSEAGQHSDELSICTRTFNKRIDKDDKSRHSTTYRDSYKKIDRAYREVRLP